MYVFTFVSFIYVYHISVYVSMDLCMCVYGGKVMYVCFYVYVHVCLFVGMSVRISC